MSANRSARRRAERDLRRRRIEPRDDLQFYADQFYDDAAGVVVLAVVRPNSALSKQDRLSISQWTAGIAAGGSPLCMCCETNFGAFRNCPGAFVTLTPARDDPALGYLLAVCESCAAVSDEQLGALGVDFVRQSGIMPDARPFAGGSLTQQSRSGMTAGPRPHQPGETIADIVAVLCDQIGELCAELLPGGVRRGGEWRAGSLAGEAGGAVAVELFGPKRGLFVDHRTDEGGDAFTLIAAVKFNGNIKAAIGWARHWLGDPDQSRGRVRTAAPKVEPPPAPEGRRAEGLQLFLAAQPGIFDTPVESYLSGERAIPVAAVLGRAPRALRFHPGIWNGESRRHSPAMVAAIVNADGKTIAAHLTWLELRGDGRVTKAPLDNPKVTYGSWKGGSIRLWCGASGKPWKDAPEGDRLLIAEGIEDGLSYAVADPRYRVIAAVNLSNIANLVIPPAFKVVVIAAQNDPWWHEGLARPHPASRGLDRAIRSLSNQGKRVLIARSPRGKDVNDLLRGCG